MKYARVRLSKITLQNFKNIEFGSIDFKNVTNSNASILGIYGQNGSGKTALIDSLQLLNEVMSGYSVADHYCDFINLDSDYATLQFEFELSNDVGKDVVSYQFSIKKRSSNVLKLNDNGVKQNRIVVFNEIVRTPSFQNRKMMKKELINTNADDLFLPEKNVDLLIGKNKVKRNNLCVSKILCADYSRSFVFSDEFIGCILDQHDVNVVDRNEIEYYLNILERLKEYAYKELFVIDTTCQGLISLKAQPFNFCYEDNKVGVRGSMLLEMNGPTVIPEKRIDIICDMIDHMNVVLNQIIPGFTIRIKQLGKQLMDDNNIGVSIQLASVRDGKELPLRYESEGIKKIVSILQLLIVVYNDASITIAIDEIDSGVFEYLLGEILRVIAEGGKGQLVFTSHNLRPLETLHKNFIAFTTVNPKNRFIRMTNVKTNNNLRDFYYRDIVVGEQKDLVYQPTNNIEIEYAFKDAKKIF